MDKDECRGLVMEYHLVNQLTSIEIEEVNIDDLESISHHN